ncbi:MAG: sigma-70 family RNA polymerase sigma factor [Anaerolineales bacterium]|nr:sigma-70 family RNA polymerase sigma factor [Anaerolineales bacterium]
MDLKEQIKNALKGDLDSFNQIVLEYQNLVYNQAYRIIGEPDAAEDAVQEAFISAYKKLHTYRGGSFKSWLLRIVSNACYDEFRRRKRQPVAPLYPENQNGDETESVSWLEDTEEKPEEFVLRNELSEAIQICLDRLEFEFRTIVVLVDLQGMDYASAAKVIDCPLGTVKSRLARARRNLKDCLQGFRELLPVEFRHLGEV